MVRSVRNKVCRSQRVKFYSNITMQKRRENDCDSVSPTLQCQSDRGRVFEFLFQLSPPSGRFNRLACHLENSSYYSSGTWRSLPFFQIPRKESQRRVVEAFRGAYAADKLELARLARLANPEIETTRVGS